MSSEIISPITTRQDFGILLNNMGLLGDGVEVGTQVGIFAEMILEKWNGAQLYCVDPWRHLEDYDDLINKTDEDRNCDMQLTDMRLKRFDTRYSLVQQRSLDAVRFFGDNSLDFVYIDGNHWRPHVDRDLQAWWEKVKPGGILAGHDYSDFWENQVRNAVLDFCKAKQIETVNVIREYESSYYIIKP